MERRMATKEQKSVLKDILASITKIRDDLKTQVEVAKSELENQIGELETMKEETETAFEELSEAQQESTKGTDMQSLIDDIETATDLCNTIGDELDKDAFEELITHIQELIK
jgi:hypothetical protein